MITLNSRNFSELQTIWTEESSKLSGNLTSNSSLPKDISDRLFSDDNFDKKYFKSITSQKIEPLKFNNELNYITGLDILAELQNLSKPNNLTLFRAIRFPTPKRLSELVNEKGFSQENYEQERLQRLYSDKEYLLLREQIKNNALFNFQPQERIVEGLPAFSLVNDAIQIHRAYRSNVDRVAIAVGFFPKELFEEGIFELYANTAIDFERQNDSRDFKITDFKQGPKGSTIIDYSSLRVRGIDVFETFLRKAPTNMSDMNKLGVKQSFYVLDIYNAKNYNVNFDSISQNSKLLKENEWFLHGFLGDHSLLGRDKAKYIPFNCYEIKSNNKRNVAYVLE
ncbi:MAG: hypothetical protein ABH828_01265 [archaeon]